MKAGFWTAVLIGVLGLVDMLFSAALGLLQAVLFFGAAWGIRRGRPWAAMAAMAMIAGPVLAILLQAIGAPEIPGWGGLAFALGVLAIAGGLLARAAVVLFRRRGQGFLTRGDVPLAVFVLLVFAVCFSIRPYVMPSDSMAKTLVKGDHLLVDVASPALGWTPKRDGLLVFRYPSDPRQTFIKRVAGLPGDRIRIRDKQLYRNGAPVTEPWAVHLTPYTDPYRDNFPGQPNVSLGPPAETMLARHVDDGEVRVPEGMVFVLGDNRDASLDSRYFGFVPRGDVVGRPFLIYASAGLKRAFRLL
jgi:signal peptidase I